MIAAELHKTKSVASIENAVLLNFRSAINCASDSHDEPRRDVGHLKQFC